ncbi:Putative methyl-CpG-binding domain protein 3-like 5 [Myotis brandtii]|uniref:Putative methyl-CpG-binding domain protein 3-like 5 n=1 Tax=Myotis brandtii TaxID=109478 RepID=S7Q9X3_MYOBR|nr:Putative methyl-CpG-binding domain protein 3-like 5 [Myotis brandtii]
MSKRRCSDRSELPMRLTSCIVKSAVTKVTTHPDNVVRRRRQKETLEKPQQMSAYRRLQGLQACSSEGELLNTSDVTNLMRITAPGSAAMSKRRCSDRSELPMRLTSCIVKSAVTKVTTHPDNVVRRRRQKETLEKPQQMSAYRRLQGLQGLQQ